MLFMLVGRDYPNALNKRLAVRSAHIELGDKLRKEGKLLFGGALLDDDGNMAGSMLICDFVDRQALDAWLEIEPYVTAGVWEKITVEQFKTGPSFINVLGSTI